MAATPTTNNREIYKTLLTRASVKALSYQILLNCLPKGDKEAYLSIGTVFGASLVAAAVGISIPATVAIGAGVYVATNQVSSDKAAALCELTIKRPFRWLKSKLRK